MDSNDKMMINVTKDFLKWAKGFSGCDGGNIEGIIWFCGIEFGGNEDERKFKFANVTDPPEISDDERKRFFGYQYNRKVAKIYSAILGKKVSNYFQIALNDRLFAKDSCVFKMNLYPISFHHDRDDLWQEWLYRKTGLPTKSMYRAWCQLYRFPEIQNWVKKYSPKLIICTGISYKNEFIMAFDGIETIYKTKLHNKKKIFDRELVWLEINDKKTILVITPFLGGKYGLNSDLLLQNFGKEIYNICASKFGKNWIVNCKSKYK